jgi:hypothetical protein
LIQLNRQSLKLSAERIKRLDLLRSDTHYNETSFEPIKKAIDDLVINISAYEKDGNEKVTSGNKISEAKTLKLKETDFAILTALTSKIASIQEVLKKDNNAVTYSNISSAKDAFLRIQKFEKEKNIS